MAGMVGPWRSVPTDGWTEELTARWLALQEMEYELNKQDLELRVKQWEHGIRQKAEEVNIRQEDIEETRRLREETIKTSRIRAENERMREQRLAAKAQLSETEEEGEEYDYEDMDDCTPSFEGGYWTDPNDPTS